MPHQKQVSLRRPIMGIMALGLGSLAIFGSISVPEMVRIINPPPPAEEQIADFAIRLKDALIDRLKPTGENPKIQPNVTDWKSILMPISMGLGVLALISATISFVRREPRRYAIASAGLAVIALAWQAVLIGISALVIISLFVLVLSWLN